MNKTVQLYDNNNEEYPSGLKECIDWLISKYESIPEEFRDCARFELDVWDGEGLKLNYTRPETPEEVAGREAAERATQESNRRRELATLKQLKEKYPDA